MKISSQVAIVLFVILSLTNCKFPKVKEMKLKKDSREIIEELKNPGGFENASLTNNVNSTNGVTTYSLELELTNGKNLPENLRDMAKEKMRLVLDNLINKSDYNNLRVVFNTQKGNGIVSTSSSYSYDFSLDEFQKTDSLGKDSSKLQN